MSLYLLHNSAVATWIFLHKKHTQKENLIDKKIDFMTKNLIKSKQSYFER